MPEEDLKRKPRSNDFSCIDSHEAFPKGSNGEVHYQRVHNILTQVLYSGYINYAPWNFTLHPGKHEPLISYGDISDYSGKSDRNSQSSSKERPQ